MIRQLILVATCAIACASHATDVGVSINFAQPGLYGRIDLGAAPPPAVVYAQPVLVQPMPYAVAPVYLHVPPGQERDWGRHCPEYNACGAPVYFLQGRWYRENYADRRGDGDGGRGHGRGHGHHHED